MSNAETKVINPEVTTVGEIVADNYHAAGVFRQYGLDFCCGGGISLKDACEKRNLDTDRVLNDLLSINWGQISADVNYQAWEPGYLIDHIIDNHHRFVRSKTKEISVYALKVASVHGERHPENKKIYSLFVKLAQELIKHLEDEEKRVFPLILDIYNSRLNSASVDGEKIEALRKEVEKMEDDHEGAGATMTEIRKLSNDFTPPEDACATYKILYQNLEGFEEDLHKHVHLENNILFKKAENLIQ